MTAALIRTIQVGAKQLGLDADTRRALQLRLVGKASLSEMTDDERKQVLEALKARGFKPTGRKGGFRNATRGDVRLIFVLWRALADAGVVRDGSNKGLNRFVQRRFGTAWGFVPVDLNTLSEPRMIEDVLKALKDWIKRENVDFDWDRVKR